MNEILLMLPGPTTADPRVLQAMGKAVVSLKLSKLKMILTSLPVQELQQWKLLFQTLLTEEIKY